VISIKLQNHTPGFQADQLIKLKSYIIPLHTKAANIKTVLYVKACLSNAAICLPSYVPQQYNAEMMTVGQFHGIFPL